jgi:hypothetical protein
MEYCCGHGHRTRFVSRFREAEPVCSRREGPISLVIRSRSRDLGGFCVRRVLPAPERRMVGPFAFVDEMGPAAFSEGEGLDVRPHPHIGLATLTWLFEGGILHRDSLGTEQLIEPGAVNLMTAGRGIVHSERSPEPRRGERRLHGLQIWMALPESLQETDPAFEHVPPERIPVVDEAAVRTAVLLGRRGREASPIRFPADALLWIQELAEGALVAAPEDVVERAVYVVDGRVSINGCMLAHGDMAVLNPGLVHTVAESASRIAVFGGEPLGRRHLWWNFVHSDRDRIEQAKHDWRAGRFPAVPGDDRAFIPLPQD